MLEFAQRQIRTQRRYLLSPARPDRALPQPAHAENLLLMQQQALSNQAVQRLLHARVIQPSSRSASRAINMNREADRVADQVMRMPDPNSIHAPAVSRHGARLHIQRMCSECKEEIHLRPESMQRMCSECEEEFRRQPMEEEEEEESLQAKAGPGRTPEVTPDVQAQVNDMRDGGQPLPKSMRAFFEPRFGHDFSDVRIHTDARAADSARAVDALVLKMLWGRKLVCRWA